MKSAILPWVKKTNKPKFVTLTLKHSDAPLADQVNNLYHFFKLLRRRSLWNSHIKSGIWFFQVKKSESSGQWHPHIHIICAGKFFPHEKLSAEWEKITMGSKVVDIRAVKNPKKAAEYVSRYATAPCELSDLEFDEAVEVFYAMHGKRLCGQFGECRGIQLSPQKCPDAEDWEKVATFAEVRLNMYQSEFHRIIWNSFMQDLPCPVAPPEPPPDESTLEGLTVPCNTVIANNDWDFLTDHKQYNFEFFN